MEAPTSGRRIDALTGLRFVAAAWVFAFHFNAWSGAAGRFAGLGWVGVSIFFVLSGYLMQHAYGPWFESSLDVARLRAYARSRFARIYPLHALVLVAATIETLALSRWRPDIAGLGSPAPALVSWIASALLVQSWWSDWRAFFNPPAWTLSCEAFFYVCLPLLARLLVSRRTTVGAVLVRIAGCAVAYLLIATTQTVVVLGLGLSPKAFVEALHYGPPARLVEFAAGMLLTGLAASLADARALREALVLGGIAVLVAPAVLAPSDPHRLALIAVFASAAVGSSMLVGGLASGPTVIGGLLGSGAMRLAGEVSYAFYLIQWPVRLLASALFGDPVHWAAWGPPLGAAICLAVAALLWALFEIPVRRAIRGR